MKQILTCLFALVCVFTGMCADSSKESVFQIRLVLENPSTNAEQVVIERPKSKETIWVDKECLLDASAVVSATVGFQQYVLHESDLPGHGQVVTNIPAIDIELTKDGAKELEKITAEHIGRRVAIFIEGKACVAPKIDDPISSGKFTIAGSFSKSEADKMVLAINASLKK